MILLAFKTHSVIEILLFNYSMRSRGLGGPPHYSLILMGTVYLWRTPLGLLIPWLNEKNYLFHRKTLSGSRPVGPRFLFIDFR